MTKKQISQFGKGAIRTSPEKLATRYRLAVGAVTPVNWDKPWRPKVIPILNQKKTLSCTAHGTVRLGLQLEYKQTGKIPDAYSRRFIYSQIALPGGGAYIYKAMGIPIKQGFATGISVPDGDTEAIETDTSLNDKAVLIEKAEKYAMISDMSMDNLANLIDTNTGFVSGFNGNDDIVNTPVLQIPNHRDWGHCICFDDYGKLPDGRKVLRFANSWSNVWGDNGYGYITEEFIKSGNLFEAYVYANLADIDPSTIMLKIVLDNSTKRQYVVGADGKYRWIYNLTLLEELHNSGVVNKNIVDVKDKVDSSLISETWAVIK